jgi:hypothetical protein
MCLRSAEFKSPVRYSPSAADSVNELLFDLLTRQLSQLGLQEVILQESDCRELLKNLDLQAAADSPLKDNDFQNSKGENKRYYQSLIPTLTLTCCFLHIKH